MTVKSRFFVLPLASLTLGSLVLPGCSNEAGQARNEAAESVAKTSQGIREAALNPAYPTPMTSEQSAEIQSMSSNPPEWVDESQQGSLRASGGQGFEPLAAAKQDYQEILQSIGPIQGTQQQQAAQRALQADAHLALAALQLETAERIDTTIRSSIALSHTRLDAVLDLEAMVASEQSFDPGPQRKQLDAIMQEARTKLSEYQTEARGVERQISTLEKSIATEIAAANSLNEQAVREREQARQAPLDDRIGRLEAAKETATRSSTHQVKASRLEAQADLIRPELQRIELLASQAQAEVRDAEAALARLDARTAQNQRTVAELRGEHEKTAEAFSEGFDPLVERFQSVLMAEYETALSSAESAIGDAKGAHQSATAQQMAGRVQWRKALSLDAMIQLVERVVEHRDALNRSAGDEALLAHLREQAQAARAGAKSALEEALITVENAPAGSADSQALLSSLTSSIRSAISYVTGEAVAEVRDLTDAPDAMPMNDSQAEPADASGPRELLRTAQRYEREGNMDASLALFYSDTPGFEAAMQQLKPLALAASRLDRACQNQFGQTLADALSGPGGMPGMNNMAMMASNSLLDTDIDSLDIRFDNSGTTAWINNDPSLSQLQMVEINGRWFFKFPDEQLALFTSEESAQFDAVARVFNDLAQQVEDGSIASGEALGQALMTQMMNQMMQSNPDMMNGGDSGSGGRRRN